MSEPIISLRGLTKVFGDKAITQGLDLDVAQGEFLTVIGRSGEGKSVLLKQIIGLIEPDSGSVVIDGTSITDPSTDRHDVFSKCGYVFQFAALLDSLTVFENVAIAQLEHGESVASVRPIVEEKIDSVGLSQDVLMKYPSELSGGMRKRVGLARTLMANPRIILYDEPTTGLDPVSTQLIHQLMKDTHDRFGATTIVISHDITIFDYCTDVAMLFEGKIVHKQKADSIMQTENPHIKQLITGSPDGPLSRD